MPKIEFGSRAQANAVRDAVSQHLALGDDRRSTTVTLAASAPSSVVERARDRAFTSQREDRASAGMAELSDAEIQSLNRQHRTFSWQKHGFEAMRAKAALQRSGVTDWQDHWEPGEGTEGALKNLRRTKQMSARTGAPASVERGRRTDEEELTGGGRQRRQAEQFAGEQVKRATESAILEADVEAASFIREEQQFSGEDIFDLSFGPTDQYGRPDPVGRDADLVRQRHANRSARARAVDEAKAAPKTRDPVEWSQRPDELDFPGVDTVDPERVHAARSKAARRTDDALAADMAASVEEWASDPAASDLPGVDTPNGGLGGLAKMEKDLLDLDL